MRTTFVALSVAAAAALALGGCPHPPSANTRCSDNTQCTGRTPNAGAQMVCCSGVCVDTASDVLNCGTCAEECTMANAVRDCVAGVCSISSCNPGYGDCNMVITDGCETRVDDNVRNCGHCANACGSVAHGMAGCQAGSCGIAACDVLWGDCDKNPANGCETSLASDMNNCGKCAGTCSAANMTGACASGRCTCKPDFGDCDGDAANGCERNLQTDAGHCGKCGMTCVVANGTGACINGKCAIGGCQPGFGDCDMDLSNGCEARLTADGRNCGRCGLVCPPNMALCSGGSCAIGVLVVGVTNLADVQQNLAAKGAFVVNTFDAGSGTPTLAMLKPYKAILVYDFGNGIDKFADPTSLGNNLADYYDQGGQVVVAANANVRASHIGGRFGNGYLLLDSGGMFAKPDSLGMIIEMGSPLLKGVNALAADGTIGAAGGDGSPINGGVVVARWASGRPLIVRGVIKGRPRVDLNFYPVSANVFPGLWTGDGATIMRNALLY